MKLLLQDKRLLREFLFRGHKAHTMDYYLIIIIFKLYILIYFCQCWPSSLTTLPVIPILCHFTILSDYQENVQILYCNVQPSLKWTIA